MILKELTDRGLIQPPDWLVSNCQYLTITGSMAYGTSADVSDFDVYGWTIPRLTEIFPHLAGEIRNFGFQTKQFETWQKHHVFDQDALGGKGREYDFTIFGVVKYFNLLLENNPNMIGSLFTPSNCLLHCTEAGQLVRDHRKKFLHKGCYIKYKSYAFSQMHKMQSKDPVGVRRDDVEKHGYDTKFAMNLVRLLLEGEQILTTGDLDLQRDREHLKAVRRGEVLPDEIRRWASAKELHLEKMFAESVLPQGPDEVAIKTLLLQVLETHYGSLDKVIQKPSRGDECVIEVKKVLERYGV